MIAEWNLVPNPSWADVAPEDRKSGRAICHDGTPFLTILCDDKHPNHIHASQLENIPADVLIIITSCKTCGNKMEFPKDWLFKAFEKAEIGKLE